MKFTAESRKSLAWFALFATLATLAPIACAYCSANAPEWLTEKVMSFDGTTVREIRHRAIEASFVIAGTMFGLCAYVNGFRAFMMMD